MLPFFAIVRLTCRSAIRSNVFRTLLFLLALSVILIPNTIKGDGTAAGFIQLILEYSLGFSGAILAISVAWVCCSEIASDVENGQIHLILVKPVPRPVVLLGKFTGVLVIHTVLLVLASAVVYGFVMYQFMRQDFPEDERQRVESEVLTGRRLIPPDKPDFAALAEKELNHRLETARMDERAAIQQKIAGSNRRTVLNAIERELRFRNGEVEPGETIFWNYSGISEKTPDPLFLRYKLYAGTDGSKNQETTYGAWLMRFVARSGGTDDAPEYTDYIVPLPPEEIMTKTRDEFGVQDTILRIGGAPDNIRKNVPPDVMKSLTGQLVKNGTFRIGFRNFDRGGKKIIFQETDGPYLMVRETGFLNNYLRAVFVLFLGILAVALVSSALAAYFTLPTSVFLAASYGLLCIFAVYLLGTISEMDASSLSTGDKFAQLLSEGVFFLLIPFRDFFMTAELATGQLIDFARIGRLLLYDILLRGVPLFLAGMLLYSFREVSLAMKR